MDIKKKLAVFLAEYELQIARINSIYNGLAVKLVAFEGEDTIKEMVESTGYWLHNLYCAFEDLFKMVVGFWENDVYMDGSFHIHLLKRMQVRIEGIRPAFRSR